MKKLIITVSCIATMSMGIKAEEQKPLSHEQLKDIANQPQVEEQLLGDDGVSIEVAKDGSFIIFSRGTGRYDFSDAGDISDARKVARLNAEKHYSKFITTFVSSTDATEEVSKNSCVLDGDGKVQSKRVSKEVMEPIKSSIASNTKAVLSGLVVLESKKVPTPGETGGTIQITMVYSSKTGKAALELGKAMQNHQAELKINEAKNDARVQAARNAAQNSVNSANNGGTSQLDAGTGSNANSGSQSSQPVNKFEHRKNKTIY